MTRLKVALDARTLQSNERGGVGRYVAGVIPHLSREVDLYLLLDSRLPDAPEQLTQSAQSVRLSAPGSLPGLAWLEVAVSPWLRRFDGLLHATFNTLPLTFKGRSVLTLHDLSVELHPEDFRPLKRAVWRIYVRTSLSRADAITTVSHFTKGQIVGRFGVDPERVRVEHLAPNAVFSADRTCAAGALAARLGIAPPYVVAIGGARRRGLPVAIEAWRQARELAGRPVTLVVAGTPAAPGEPGIVAPGFLDDEAWATLLAGAQALCYPTRYEGFGLPALEAAASGTPVVCAPVASLPEVLGEAGCWAAAPTAPEIAEVLARVLTDEPYHRERRDAGLEQARRAPSYEQVAQTILDAYRDAAA